MKKNFLISLGMIAALAAMTGCGGKTTTATQEIEKVLVRTSPAILEEVDQTASFTSNIQAFVENNIAPAAPMRIQQILVDVGSTVRKGQLLARMDPTQLDQVAIQLSNTQIDYDRTKTVYDAGGISKQQLDQLETQLNVYRTQYNNLKENTEIMSPIDGVVTARNYDAGDMFNGSIPILQVMQISTLKVTISISEQYFPLVKQEMSADVTVETYPGRTFAGKVSLIHPAIDPGTRTFTIEITLPNPKGELRPGMFSRTTLNFGKEEGILVDDIAVQKQVGTNERYLFVAKNGVAERRTVEVGTQIGGKFNILSGVQSGEQVIIAGISRLMDGTEIEVRNN